MKYHYLILLPDIVTKHSKRYRCKISQQYTYQILLFMKYRQDIHVSLRDIVTRCLLLSAGCQDLLKEDYSHCGWLRKQSFINRIGKFRCKCNTHFYKYLIKVTLYICVMQQFAMQCTKSSCHSQTQCSVTKRWVRNIA